MFKFQALSARRFQRGFNRVNLHRPTEGAGKGLVLPTRRGAQVETVQIERH